MSVFDSRIDRTSKLLSMLRVKLHFAPELGLDPETTKIWWFIDTKECSFISDLIYQLFHRLNLKKIAPCGLVLTMDEYTLLPSQPIGILRDNDSIWVRRSEGNDTSHKGNTILSPPCEQGRTGGKKRKLSNSLAPIDSGNVCDSGESQNPSGTVSAPSLSLSRDSKRLRPTRSDEVVPTSESTCKSAAAGTGESVAPEAHTQCNRPKPTVSTSVVAGGEATPREPPNLGESGAAAMAQPREQSTVSSSLPDRAHSSTSSSTSETDSDTELKPPPVPLRIFPPSAPRTSSKRAAAGGGRQSLPSAGSKGSRGRVLGGGPRGRARGVGRAVRIVPPTTRHVSTLLTITTPSETPTPTPTKTSTQSAASESQPSSTPVSGSKITSLEEKEQKEQYYASLPPHLGPILVGDRIAFKLLEVGPRWEPQLSKFKVRAVCVASDGHRHYGVRGLTTQLRAWALLTAGGARDSGG
jgi:hypothetical protein